MLATVVVTVGNRPMVNFAQGGTIQISVSNNPSGNRIDVLVSAAQGSGANFGLNDAVAQRYVLY